VQWPTICVYCSPELKAIALKSVLAYSNAIEPLVLPVKAVISLIKNELMSDKSAAIDVMSFFSAELYYIVLPLIMQVLM
jgi:hypothetical protein